jgi:tryptophan synthase beta chain
MYRYDYGDTVSLTPLIKMFTLGHNFIPAGIHAGGLRYHGCSPIVSALQEKGIISAVAYNQIEVFKAAVTFARTEGIVPAPESCHAIAAAVREAKKCTETGEKKVILFNLSGHGLIDMAAYDQFLSGNMVDVPLDPKDIESSLHDIE